MHSFKEIGNNGEYGGIPVRERQSSNKIHSDVRPGPFRDAEREGATDQLNLDGTTEQTETKARVLRHMEGLQWH